MKKRLIFIIIGLGIGVICFIAGWWVRNVQCDEFTICYDYAVKIDSLKWLEVVREDEQLPYYGMKKEKALAVLPQPRYSENKIVYDDGNLSLWHLLYRPYEKRVIGTQDTIIVEYYYWEIPYHDRPNLYIVFEKKDTSWIATTCIQWNPELVYID